MSNNAGKRNIVRSIFDTADNMLGSAVDALADSGRPSAIAGAMLQPLLNTGGYQDKQDARAFSRERIEEARKNFAHADWQRDTEKELHVQSQEERAENKEERRQSRQRAEEDWAENKADREVKREREAKAWEMQMASNEMALHRQRLALDSDRQNRKQQEIEIIAGNIRGNLALSNPAWNDLTLPEQDFFMSNNGPVKEYMEALWGARNLLKARDGDQQALDDVIRELEEAGIKVVADGDDYVLVVNGQPMPLNEESVMAAIQQLEGAVAGEMSVASQIGTHANGGMVMNGVMGEYVSEFAKYNGGVLVAAQKSFNDAYGQLTVNEKIYMALSKLSDKFSTAKDDEEKMSLWDQATPLLDRLGVQIKLGPTGQPYIYDERKTFGEREYSVEGFGQIMKQKDTGSQKLQSALKTQQTLALQQEAAEWRKIMAESKKGENESEAGQERLTDFDLFSKEQEDVGAQIVQNDVMLKSLYNGTIRSFNVANPKKAVSRRYFNRAVGVATNYALNEAGEDETMLFKLFNDRLKINLKEMNIRLPKKFGSEYERKFLQKKLAELSSKMAAAPAGGTTTYYPATQGLSLPYTVPDENAQKLTRLHEERNKNINRVREIDGFLGGNDKYQKQKQALFGP